MSWRTSTCKDCQYFEKNTTQIGVGVCRHSPPGVSTIQKQVGMRIEVQTIAAYPIVKTDSKACGQFKMVSLCTRCEGTGAVKVVLAEITAVDPNDSLAQECIVCNGNGFLDD